MKDFPGLDMDELKLLLLTQLKDLTSKTKEALAIYKPIVTSMEKMLDDIIALKSKLEEQRDG